MRIQRGNPFREKFLSCVDPEGESLQREIPQLCGSRGESLQREIPQLCGSRGGIPSERNFRCANSEGDSLERRIFLLYEFRNSEGVLFGEKLLSVANSQKLSFGEKFLCYTDPEVYLFKFEIS